MALDLFVICPWPTVRALALSVNRIRQHWPEFRFHKLKLVVDVKCIAYMIHLRSSHLDVAENMLSGMNMYSLSQLHPLMLPNAVNAHSRQLTRLGPAGFV